MQNMCPVKHARKDNVQPEVSRRSVCIYAEVPFPSYQSYVLAKNFHLLGRLPDNTEPESYVHMLCKDRHLYMLLLSLDPVAPLPSFSVKQDKCACRLACVGVTAPLRIRIDHLL